MGRNLSVVLSVLLVLFGLLMLYTGMHDRAEKANVDTALGVVLIVYGIARYFLFSRMQRPRD